MKLLRPSHPKVWVGKLNAEKLYSVTKWWWRFDKKRRVCAEDLWFQNMVRMGGIKFLKESLDIGGWDIGAPSLVCG